MITRCASRFRSRRLTLPDLLAHQLFRLVPRKVIEKYGAAVDRPGEYRDLWCIQVEIVEAI